MRFFPLVFSLATLATLGCNSEERATTPKPAAATSVGFNVGGNPTVQFASEGLHCEMCDASACETLAEVPGVIDILADHKTNTITVAIDDATFENDAALTALHENKLFKDAKVVGDTAEATGNEEDNAG